MTPIMILASIVSLVFGAAQVSAEGSARLRALLWTDGEEGALTHALAAGTEDFISAGNEAYSIDVEWAGREKSEARLDALIASGLPPDVFMTDALNLPCRVAAGQVHPLEGALASDPSWHKHLPSPLLDLLSIGGKVYAVPIAQTAAFVYYNKSILKVHDLMIPSTYEDLKKIVRALAGRGVTPIAFANKEGWEGVLLAQLIQDRLVGSEVFQKAVRGQIAWTDPSFLETGDVLTELVELHAFPERFGDLANDQAIQLFRQGKAAMLLSRDRLFASLNFSSSAVKNKVELGKFPLFPGGAGDRDSWIGSPDFDLAVSSASSEKDAAVSFVKTYMSDDLQAHFAAHVFLPVTRPGLDAELLLPLQKRALDLLSDITRISLPHDAILSGQRQRQYTEAIRSILSGVSPAAAFSQLQAWWKEAMD